MQKNTPKKRKQIRLKEYDYSTPGYYFITICTQNRKEILSKILINSKNEQDAVGADDSVRPNKNKYVNNNIELTNIGRIVNECWNEIDKIYEGVEIGEFIIMPNHVHGIIILNGRTGSSAPTKDYARI